MVSSRHKDIFEDILEERKETSDLCYALKNRDVPVFKLNKPRTPQQIKDQVMGSDRVKFAIEQVSSMTYVVLSSEFFFIYMYFIIKSNCTIV